MDISQAQARLKQAARALHAGKLKQAEIQYLSLLSDKIEEEYVLNQLVDISLHLKQQTKAVDLMKRLVKLAPHRYSQELATLYQQSKQWSLACNSYAEFVSTNDGKVDADCRYNYAFNLKQAGLYQEAIQNYQIALALNIAQPEEVLLNMAVIYAENLRSEAEAITLLELACQKNKMFTPALFNLAQLYEEQGHKTKAADKYREVLALEPENFAALARLLELSQVSSEEEKIILRVESALRDQSLDSSTRIDLLYAHGKAMDGCQNYDLAFKSYATANAIESELQPPYSKADQEKLVDQNIRTFSAEWFKKLPKISDATPIFICGMFRSGSTLVEQILASHSAVTAGGERDYFIRAVAEKVSPYPKKVTYLNSVELQSIAQGYLQDLRTAFPEHEFITDKRPDNFLYIGLIKSLFPNAKIVYTSRNPIDNGLSIYFVRLAHRMSYATTLENIAHFIKQHHRLMSFWQSQFSADIFQVNYDELVADPIPSLRDLFYFLGLEWHNDHLEFHKLDNRVKTASVWQVRQPLYTSSSGRYENYKEHIRVLQDEF